MREEAILALKTFIDEYTPCGTLAFSENFEILRWCITYFVPQGLQQHQEHVLVQGGNMIEAPVMTSNGAFRYTCWFISEAIHMKYFGSLYRSLLVYHTEYYLVREYLR